MNKIDKLQKYIEQSNFKEALRTIDKLLKREKNSSLLNTKGVILLQDGKINYAIEIFLDALKLEPDFGDALNNLGMAYQKIGNYEKAIIYLKNAIALNSNYIQARYNLAITYDALDEPYKVVEELKLLLTYDSKNSSAMSFLGDTYNRLNNLQEALKYHEEALKLELSPHNLFKVGMDYIFQGNKQRGIDCFKPTLPYYIPSFYALVTHTDFKFSESDLDFLKKTFDNEKDIKKQSLAGFALAKILKKKNKYEKSFKVLVRANDLLSNLLPFNQENFSNKIDKIQDFYLSLKKKKLQFSDSGLRPIFILGPPRSGSTFIEQIISNHRDVYGAGEVDILHKFFDNIISKENISIKILSKLRDDYFLFVKKMTNKKYFIDKTPFNSFYVGLIKIIFPEAIVLNTNRNYKFVAYSIYETNFDNLNYSFKQEDIVFYLKKYKKNLEFWNKENFKNFINLSLEDFLKNKEQETQKIFSLLKLEFNKKYLDTSKNTKPVYTASAGQVRGKAVSPFAYNIENYGKTIENFNLLIDSI